MSQRLYFIMGVFMAYIDPIMCESYETVNRGGYFCIIRQPGNVLIFDRLTDQGARDILGMLAWEHGWMEGVETTVERKTNTF
jgi:hypothetical protein